MSHPRPSAKVPQSTALKLFVVLARAQAAIARHTEEQVAARGVTVTEWAILEAIYHKGPMLLGDVQRAILVSSGGITYLVDRLEKRGLVARKACPTDRRARYATLTAAGESLVRDAFPEHQECIEQAMKGLNATEQRECARLLKLLGKYAAELDSSLEERAVQSA